MPPLGILHSEKNDSWRLNGQRHDHEVHFVQMWVPPDTRAIEPGYEQLDIGDQLGPVDAGSGELVVVASGMPGHRDQQAISIRQQHAARVGQPNLTRGPLEERHGQLAFQGANGHRQGRLDEMKAPCGPGEVPFLGDDHAEVEKGQAEVRERRVLP